MIVRDNVPLAEDVDSVPPQNQFKEKAFHTNSYETIDQAERYKMTFFRSNFVSDVIFREEEITLNVFSTLYSCWRDCKFRSVCLRRPNDGMQNLVTIQKNRSRCKNDRL